MDTRSLAGTAVTGGTRRTGTTGVGSTTGRLNAIADGVNVFYGDLEEETEIRKQVRQGSVADRRARPQRLPSPLATASPCPAALFSATALGTG